MQRLATPLIVVFMLVAGPIFADVDGGDFDSLPPGPYTGTGDVLEGDPANVMIRQVVDGTTQGAPLPTNASGNMLCVDAVQKSSRIIIEFTFSCPGTDPSGVCQVEYDYSTAQYTGGGLEVFTDPMGDYSNPDDVVDIPVGFPPSTTFGHNSETAGQCTGDTHTITFVVYPGTILYLDNLVTDCLLPTPNDEPTWGELKTLYR